MLILLPVSLIGADGGYVTTTKSIAISAVQGAIIIKNGNEVSMTFSTGYTGDRDDFGWIIPTPLPPAIEDVSEDGNYGEIAFNILDDYSAPIFTTHYAGSSGGCFPSGTEVLTVDRPQMIEAVEQGTEVYSFDLTVTSDVIW